MKKSLIAGAALASLLALPALAEQGQSLAEGRSIAKAQVQAMVQARFAAADANRDGFVTRDEVRAGRQPEARRAERGARRSALFDRLDANRDGSISRAEFNAPRAQGGDRAGRRADRLQRRGDRPARPAGLGLRQFERMDTNRDGRVSLAEATSVRLAAFDRLDTDRDGLLSAQERLAARAQRLNRTR